MALNIKQVPSPNHYNGRNGHRVTHITLHIMVGRLAGTDAVFQRPSSQASAHYGIGGTGEIHQYVSEANGSYSDANFSSNNSTISIEHEGGMAGVPMTDACVEASAQLCADISRRYGARQALARRVERQRVAAPRDTRHRPLRMPRPRTERSARPTGHRPRQPIVNQSI